MAATHLDTGLRCIKYLLFAVNALFVLTGIMIISIGTTIHTVYDDFSHFLDRSYVSPASMLIIVGVLIFVIAFFGCCGAIRESTCMVLVFAVSLSIALGLEVAAAMSAYAYQDGIKSVLASEINATMHNYQIHGDATVAVDFMQSKLRCCGIESSKDWHGIIDNRKNDYPFPESCCAWMEYFPKTDVRPVCGSVYKSGCLGRLETIVERSALNLGTGAIAIALIQLTGIMFACTLGRAIRRQKTERERRRWELRESIVNGYQPLGKTDPFTTFPVIYMQPDFPLKPKSNW